MLEQLVETLERAEPLYFRSLEIRERALGTDHPEVADSLNSLAELYSQQGLYDRAPKHHQTALAGAKILVACGKFTHSESPEGLSKGLARYPIPVMILARLAVDNRFQGQRLGQGLWLDALRRTINAADIAGIRAMLVHAKDESAGKFYGHFGFEPFPASPLTMYKLLKDIRSMMG